MQRAQKRPLIIISKIWLHNSTYLKIDFVGYLKFIKHLVLSKAQILSYYLLSINRDIARLIMKKTTYQATLKDLALLVTTENYSDPELTQNLLQFGVNDPIIFTTDGTKSRFGMKKLNVKDGMKRLNLAATNPEVGKLTAQVILIEEKAIEFAPVTQVKSSAPKTEHLYQNTYNWKNEKRNIFERCTATELGKKYGIRLQYLNTVIQGKVKCSRGWSLVQS